MKYKMKRIIKDDSKPIEEMGEKIIKPEKIIKASIDTEVSNEIWIYDEETQKWNNRINEIKQMYIEKHQEDYSMYPEQDEKTTGMHR